MIDLVGPLEDGEGFALIVEKELLASLAVETFGLFAGGGAVGFGQGAFVIAEQLQVAGDAIHEFDGFVEDRPVGEAFTLSQQDHAFADGFGFGFAAGGSDGVADKGSGSDEALGVAANPVSLERGISVSPE